VDNQSMVYMAYDGDNAGRLCGRAILADNPDALHEISNRIALGHEVVRRWVESHNGQFISGGGDEGVFSIPAEAIDSVEELRADYKFATNLTATVGIGSTLSEAGKAMLVGKFRGKNTTVQYTPEIEQEIRQAQSHLSSGTANAEEKKIGEAYLQNEGTVSTMATENKSEQAPAQAAAPHDDCPYCAELQATSTQDDDHCKYCHDLDSQTDDCPYCKEAASPMESAGDCPYCKDTPAANDGCPYCAQPGSSATSPDQVVPTAGPTIKNPTTTDSENYAGQDLNNPDLPKPDPIQQNPDGLGSSFDGPTVENVKLDAMGQGSHQAQGAPNENQSNPQGADPQSEETIESIAQEIEAQPNDSNPEAQTVRNVNGQNTIDAANTATSDNMQGNVSRPDGFDDPNQPSDMGLAEDDSGAPDITGVMQEGLDSHADNIQREKVVNLVSEALMGFKACKGILEKSKIQAPQLYESSIAMLKAMIEMAKMLGLDQEANADSANPLGDSQSQPAAATPNSPIDDSSSQNQDQHAADPKQGPQAGIPKYQQAASKGDAEKDPKAKGQSVSQ
jgi:hypothetical protein